MMDTTRAILAALTLALVTIAALAAPTGAAAAGFPDDSCVSHIRRAEAAHNIPHGLLYAVALAESGRGGVPHAWTLNIDGQPYYELTYERAVRRLREASQTTRNIAIGCMQIFKRYHPTDDPAVYLRPAFGVDYAARYLVRLRNQHGTWTRAVARYHAGERNFVAQRIYVCSVWRHMRRLGLPVSAQGYSFCAQS